jgi:sarcosine oxidase
MTKPFDVIVVGLGAMGSSTVYHLAQRGLRVLGLDRFSPPHTFGSSHGQTRIIREAYFEHPLYVPLVQQAYRLWRRLEKESATPLLLTTGGVMIGPAEGTLIRGSQHSAEVNGLRYERLSSREICRRFPALHPGPGMVGIWEPNAGILFPEQCIAAHLRLARKAGATLRLDETVVKWQPDGSGVQARTRRGTFRASHLVLAAGSWIARLVPDLRLPSQVERQVLFWFAAKEPAHFAPAVCPIHLWEYKPGRFFYGFPDLGQGVKVARHHQGEITRPDRVRRKVSADEVACMQRLLRPFLLELGPLRSSAVCLYTNLPDEHFLIDCHPACSQVLIVSPCSGHGFKFSSAIGEVVSDLIQQGRSQFDLRLFRLDRF